MFALGPVKDWKIQYKVNAILLFTASLALIMALTGIVFHDHTVRREILAKEIYILSALTAKRSTAALQFLDKKAATENLEALKVRSIIRSACLYDSSGSLYVAMNNPGAEQEPIFSSECPETVPTVGIIFSDVALESVVEVEIREMVVGHLYVRASLSEIKKRLHHSIVISSIILLGSLLATLLLALPIQQRLTKPILELRDLAIKISKNQNFSVRANIDQRDEVGDTALAFNLMLTTIEKSNEELFLLAYFDSMTGLGNRRQFMKALELALVKTRYSKKVFAVILLDIDKIRPINEKYGHNIGDLVLQTVAKRLKEFLPENADPYRLGSDEFIIILKRLEGQEEARAVVDLIHENLKKPMDLEGQIVSITCSSGVALSSGFDTCYSMMKRADLAMDEAKASGKDCYRISKAYVSENK